MAIYDSILKRSARRSDPTFGAMVIGFAIFGLTACQTKLPQPAPIDERQDDEIIVDGQRFHTGTRVVTWEEQDGYNAYEFQPTKLAGKANHGVRRLPSAKDDGTWIDATEPWNLVRLQSYVDQFVLHYDSEGFSKKCFEVLQRRGLSAHFLLDLDGTIYQTLDLRDRAYHATSSNSRSIGIEIAQVGAFGPGEENDLSDWYLHDESGKIVLKTPEHFGDPQHHIKEFIARPIRSEKVEGVINHRELQQYDFTPEQYAALIKLTAALHQIFPLIALDYPRDAEGKLAGEKLPDEDLKKFRGIIGHFHIQQNKIDPGPAFQWDMLIDGAKAEISE